ncbi:hypothetical protein KUCAC02_007728 [Chaenocephalus aceratus]|uniref:Uncharacterized protein n=1 Tax=Chaenocephalus aceratus TaxID=36190 RepID=A0ACB9X8H7_CHAAC|nr:hypothetical protein KUCAC02_007728 [Chaenocephalus aceratus]
MFCSRSRSHPVESPAPSAPGFRVERGDSYDPYSGFKTTATLVQLVILGVVEHATGLRVSVRSNISFPIAYEPSSVHVRKRTLTRCPASVLVSSYMCSAANTDRLSLRKGSAGPPKRPGNSRVLPIVPTTDRALDLSAVRAVALSDTLDSSVNPVTASRHIAAPMYLAIAELCIPTTRMGRRVTISLSRAASFMLAARREARTY